MLSNLRGLSVLAICIVFACISLFPSAALAYPAYTAHSDLVIVAPYDTAVSGAGNWGSTASNTRDFLTLGQKYRIRQNGTISRVRLYTAAKPTGFTGFYVTVWRKNGSTYDLVGKSNNIVNDLIATQTTTIDLTTSISGVQEGDYYGYRIESTSSTSTNVARTSQSGVTTYSVTNSTPSVSGYNWAGQVASSGTVLPIELYMQAPQFVFIGDSIIAGHYANYSFLESDSTNTNIASTMEKYFSNITGYSYQNMGIGGQTTTQIVNRFVSDVVNTKPAVVVIEGGVNDVFDGDVTKETFLNNWKTMFDAAQANNINVLALKILPWTEGSNSQEQTTDDWNNALASLATNYPNVIVIDTSSYIGQFRPGGDSGNLWDIQPVYDSDTVHFTAAGNAQIAQAIADALPKDIVTHTSSGKDSLDNPDLSYVVDQGSKSVKNSKPLVQGKMDIPTTLTITPADSDRVQQVQLRVMGKTLLFKKVSGKPPYSYKLVIPPFSKPGKYPYSLTVQYGITTKTSSGILVIQEKAVKLSQVENLFHNVYGRLSSMSELQYWKKRLNDKPGLTQFIGAMNWHLLHSIIH